MVDKIRVMEKEWQYLIILDACRYDYFSKVYRDYLSGELKKVISPGSHTLDWCKESFPKRYDDVIYVSANPFINSKWEAFGFTAKKHFHKVIDVWDWGWDEKLGTVHPKEVNKTVQKLKDNYPDKRFIIHYVQPHHPYLGYKLRTPFGRPRLSDGRIMRALTQRPLSIKEKSWLKLLHATGRLAEHTFFKAREDIWEEQRVLWKIRKLLNLPPASYMEAVQRQFGDSGLREGYVQNLRLVLTYVSRLVENLNGVIIITADHGERLGERGVYDHRAGLSDPSLLEVPWFKVEKAAGALSLHERAKLHHAEQ